MEGFKGGRETRRSWRTQARLTARVQSEAGTPSLSSALSRPAPCGAVSGRALGLSCSLPSHWAGAVSARGMFLNYELELEAGSLTLETVASRLSASPWGCCVRLHSHVLRGLCSASQDTEPGRVKPLDKGAWFWLGERGWRAQAGAPGDEGGRAGGWGPRAPAGGKLGLLPRGAACSNLPTGTAPGHGAHTAADHAAPMGPPRSPGVHTEGGALQTRAFVTSTPKPDLGSTEAGVRPKSRCQGSRKACAGRRRRPLTQGSA